MIMHHQLELVDEYNMFHIALNTRHVLLQWELRVIVPDSIAQHRAFPLLAWPASAELPRLQDCTCHHLAPLLDHRRDPKVMMRDLQP
jgi:hypothetical protein